MGREPTRRPEHARLAGTGAGAGSGAGADAGGGAGGEAESDADREGDRARDGVVVADGAGGVPGGADGGDRADGDGADGDAPARGRPATLTVLKLGGSVVTEKSTPETVDREALDAVADALGEVAGTGAGSGAPGDHGTDAVPARRRPAGAGAAGSDAGTGPGGDGNGDGDADRDPNSAGSPAAAPAGLVVVHGGGSFGHHHAERFGVTETAGTRDARAVTAVHGAMKRLNGAVVDALQGREVPAVPVHPLSAAARDRTGALSIPEGAVRTALGEGFVPVTHGDGVFQAGAGVTVLSGDELVVALARSLGADRVGLCSAVPGVYGPDGTVLDRIDAYADVADALGDSDAADVTGGMAGKVRRLLGLSAPASVFGPDDLPAFLAGGRPGTTVYGDDG